MPARHAGFTLVELTIVLVIVGLLMGGAMMAQEIIHAARVKSLAGDFRAVAAYVYGYQDIYRALPGDDPAVAARINGATAATTPASRQGNRRIDAAWNSTAGTDESRLFWQHVRLANLATGPSDPADPAYTPRNAFGGIVGISGTAPGQLQVSGMAGDYQVCSARIPGRFAKQLELVLDDGETATGAMRAVPDGSPPSTLAVAADAVEGGALYTVCMTF